MQDFPAPGRKDEKNAASSHYHCPQRVGPIVGTLARGPVGRDHEQHDLPARLSVCSLAGGSHENRELAQLAGYADEEATGRGIGVRPRTSLKYKDI